MLMTGTTRGGVDAEASDEWSVIQRLQCFNAKERYWAVRQALGHFQPDPAFVESAVRAAGVPGPKNMADLSTVFLAMDYHLNWLNAALTTYKPDQVGIPNVELRNAEKWRVANAKPSAAKTSQGDTSIRAVASRPSYEPFLRYQVENSQEDIDLLLAYERADGVTQIILIEAKCTSSFTAAQLRSKAVRLAGILEDKPRLASTVDVRLVLMSPRPTESSKAEKSLKDAITGLHDYLSRARTPDMTPIGATAASEASDTLIANRYEQLVPNPATGDDTEIAGWMPMQVSPFDPKGFWLVDFGNEKNGETKAARLAAGKKGERWRWDRWNLRRRKLSQSPCS